MALPYTHEMKSRIAEEVRQKRQRLIDAMTPAERLATALTLGRRAIDDYIRNFNVSREQALRDLRRAGQAGRRYSRCLDDEAHEPDRAHR